MRLVGYTRVSTEEQALRGHSLTVQRDRLESFARALEAELVFVASDEGVSARIPLSQRDGFKKAMAFLENDLADGLVAVKLDRFSRSTRDVLDLMGEFDRRSWRLVSVAEQLDTSTAAGRFVITILASLAQMEREQIAERVTAVMAHLRRENRPRGNIIPYGWRLRGFPLLTRIPLRQGRTPEETAALREPYVPHAEERALLLQMVELRQAGTSYVKIAQTLGTNPRTGRPWNPGNVLWVLRSYMRRIYDEDGPDVELELRARGLPSTDQRGVGHARAFRSRGRFVQTPARRT